MDSVEGYLDEQWRVLSVEGVLGQLVSVHHPRVSEDLTCSQTLVRVDMQHLGHKILRGQRSHKLLL